MPPYFDAAAHSGRLALLVAALVLACGFEVVNGFHDTANAVATVIYTNSLRPRAAVAWSGLCNFLGASLGGIAVAVSITKLLPIELMTQQGSSLAPAMLMAILVAAILWNLGTWYLGLPASSSHTLVGAILGVCVASSLLAGHPGEGVGWEKLREAGLSLIISPVVGLTAAGLLLLLSKRLFRSPHLHAPPTEGKPPPWWIRAVLILTCSGVSYAHGSNDGQKGIGLVMLILVGVLPGRFALDAHAGAASITQTVVVAEQIASTVRAHGAEQAQLASADRPPPQLDALATTIVGHLDAIRATLADKRSIGEIPAPDRWDVRRRIVLVDAEIDAFTASRQPALSPEASAALKGQVKHLRGLVDYAPAWVLVLVALCLGVGMTIGWRRIVVTVGEKIGKHHLTYAQGASAELVAMGTIGIASGVGLPVSTTHVLSSGIAGTMLAQRVGVQRSTVRNIALAWLLTIPATMLLAAALLLIFTRVFACLPC